MKLPLTFSEGKIFGRLKIIERAGKDKYNACLWLCLCECGNFKTVSASKLRNGFVQSCGCLLKEAARNHLAIARQHKAEKRQNA